MPRRSTQPPFLTKPGRHGTLYRFRIRYTDRWDSASPIFDWHAWAYDAEHAEERFFNSEDDGWKIVSGPERMREASRDRAREKARASIAVGARGMAERGETARELFIAYAEKHGALTRKQAEAVLAVYQKQRLVRLDHVTGQFHVKHGAFLDRTPLRRAAGLEKA